MTVKTAGTYMQMRDLCNSCSKQNYCGNGTTGYYCTGYAPIVYTWINPLQGGTMLEPFDSEFLSQELRDSWKKIEELEKENRELREKLEFMVDQEELDWEHEEWNREQYGDY